VIMSEIGMTTTFGPAYDEARDGNRVAVQMAAIYTHIAADAGWYTLGHLEDALGYPQASISAQLRHLRKHQFGGHRIQKRHVGGGLWEYRLHDIHTFIDGECDCGLSESPTAPHQIEMPL
jgi:hypothetical protein